MSTPDIKIHGIRTSIPTGYVLGRTKTGTGDVHLIPIGKVGGIAGVTAGGGAGSVAGGGGTGGTGGGGGSGPVGLHDFLAFQALGPFTAHQQFAMAFAPKAVLFPSLSQSSRSNASATFPPQGSTSFVLTNNLAAYLASGTNIITTVSFAAGSHTGTFVWCSPAVVIPLGAVMYIVMNATPDPSFAGVQALFCGDPQ